jgi:hypothetical protein
MTTIPDAPAPPVPVGLDQSRASLAVEYWTVVMNGQGSCDSCDDTLGVLDAALEEVRPIAQLLGLAVEVVPRAVESWTDAVENGIVASPTLRAAGVELRPSHPDRSEARVWRWRGITTGSARLESLLDFLIRALAVRSEQINTYLVGGGPAPYVRQFLESAPVLAAVAPDSSSCCGPDVSG